jgi:hypothetical protein
MRSTTGRLRFQPSCPALSLPHQAPNERGENAGIRKRRHPEEPLALDPLQNEIRRDRTSTAVLARLAFRPFETIAIRSAMTAVDQSRRHPRFASPVGCSRDACSDFNARAKAANNEPSPGHAEIAVDVKHTWSRSPDDTERVKWHCHIWQEEAPSPHLVNLLNR